MKTKIVAIVAGIVALVAVVGGVLWFAGEEVADQQADNALTEMLATLPPGYTVTYQDVDAAVTGDSATVRQIDIEVDFKTYLDNLPEAERQSYADEDLLAVKDLNIRLRAGELSVSDFDNTRNPPLHATYEVRDFELAFRGLPAEAEAALESFLGSRKITGQASGTYRADPESGLLEISDYILVLDSIGRISMDGRFGGYYEWPENGQYATTAANAETMTIEQLTLSFTDSGLMDKVYDIMAADGEMTREEAKQGLGFMVALMAASMASSAQGEVGTQSVQALVAFLENPGTLTLRMDPPVPVLASAFDDGATDEELMAAFERLNLSVTAE